jgi:signal transduction histidine kinase
MNFLSNAVKFTKKNGKIIIKCSKYPEKGRFGMLMVEVIDNGIGIEEQNLNKLFKLFGYLEESKEINAKGIGLGLHICKMVTN